MEPEEVRRRLADLLGQRSNWSSQVPRSRAWRCSVCGMGYVFAREQPAPAQCRSCRGSFFELRRRRVAGI
ncbi:MAG TPA: hypothetical protein VNO84_13555 [Burkholderiaceae bacterium]|nr:hypothetical protein [Burkholderiaceae bacterium]